MSDTLEQFVRLLHKSRAFRAHSEEKNIFALGGRGYYENPTTDLLAFFAHPQETHDFGDLVLKSLFDCLYEKGLRRGLLVGDLVGDPSREESTQLGNRIDLLIEGMD